MPQQQSKGAAAVEDLQTRIRAAELAVIRRDARVREHLGVLSAHAQRISAPGHWLSAGGLGAFLLGRLFFNRGSREPRRDKAEGGSPWWASFLPLLWPLMPKRLRRHANPAAFGLVLRLLTPLLGRWLQPGRDGSRSRSQPARASRS